MMRIIPNTVSIVASLIVASVAMGGEKDSEIPEPSRRAIAEEFASQLAHGEFEDATKNFDETMQNVIGPSKLAETWNKVAEQCGEFGKFGEARHQAMGEFDAYIFPGQWKSFALEMQVTVTKSGKITGLFFKPSAPSHPYKAPSYVKEQKFSERDLEIGSEKWPLKAKLTIPVNIKRAPGVVLVHGSGPNDMDETIGFNRPFRDIALGLASRGVIVLRYNKRTHTHGAAMKPEDINVHAEVIDDAIAALKELRKQPEVDPKNTFVIGHSLGACLAPIIAEEDGELAGVILLAGTLRPMEDVLIEQLEYIAALPGSGQSKAAEMLDDSRKTLEAFRKGESGDAHKLMGVPMSYWQDLSRHMGERGANAIRGFKGRILVMNGGRDYQIRKADFDRWREVLSDKGSATFEWIPNVNHLFCKGKGMSTPSEYANIEKHVAADVIKGLASWIKTGSYATAKSVKKTTSK